MASIDQTGNQASGIMKSLGVGSGVDVQGLARSLAEAENSSKISILNNRKSAVEKSLSGYAVVSTFLDTVKQNFDALKNVSLLSEKKISSSNTESLSASVIGNATPGQYGVDVQQLAQGTVLQSSGFSAKDSSLNAGSSFNVQISFDDGTTKSVSIGAGKDTPEGIVAAINAADYGVKATLVNKSAAGNDWHIVLEGETGSTNDFSVTTDAVGSLGFDSASNKLLTAQDAIFAVNGVAGIVRSSNQISDVISGVMFDIKSKPSASVTVTVTRDNAPMKTGLQSLVESYNQFNSVLDELIREPDDTSDEYTGSLRRDLQFVYTIRRKVKDLLTQDSSTASGGLTSLRDIGLNLKLDGTAEFDELKLDNAVAVKPDALAGMLSGGTDNVSDLSLEDKGFAQDASIVLNSLLGPQGIITQRKASGNSQIGTYERDLESLQARLEATYQRYVSQFSAMESLVERMNGIGDYLKGQFTAMENMYKN